MMADVLRTVAQFVEGPLKNVDIALVEASPNLVKQQQDKILEELQQRQNIFLSYDLKTVEQRSEHGVLGKQTEVQIERFHNKDLNFSISWYPDLRSLYNYTIEQHLEKLEQTRQKTINDKKSKKGNKKQKPRDTLFDSDGKRKKPSSVDQIKPMFVMAHELYDALPIHQFKYLGKNDWTEMCVKLEGIDYSRSGFQGKINLSADDDQQVNQPSGDLIFGETGANTENVVKVLQPSKFFSEEAKKDLKVGDTFEVCPSASDFTKDIASLVELTRGAALVVDYGEDHAFSNSFRGIQNHKLVKDWPTIFNQVGRLDLTSYVNFKQIAQLAKMNKKIITHGPMP